jgi:hypothetical protein
MSLLVFVLFQLFWCLRKMELGVCVLIADLLIISLFAIDILFHD